MGCLPELKPTLGYRAGLLGFVCFLFKTEVEIMWFVCLLLFSYATTYYFGTLADIILKMLHRSFSKDLSVGYKGGTGWVVL